MNRIIPVKGEILMKKVVFYCLLFVLCGVSQIPKTHAILGNGTYEFETYDIKLDYFRDEQRVRGYYINKFGDMPFSITYQREVGWIELDNVAELDGNHVFMGRLHDGEGDNFYKGFFMVYSPEGQFIQEVILEQEVEVNMEYMFEVDGVYIAVMEGFSPEGEQRQDRYYIIVYDKAFNVLEQIEVFDHYTDIIQTERMILYNTGYDDEYDGAYTTSLELIEPTNALMISTDQVFEEEVYIPFINDAVLNGDTVTNGVLIEYPGYYTLVYNDYTYTFTVTANVNGVEDGGIYQELVQPYFDVGKATLNDDVFASGETIEEPGDYILRIEGLNGYLQEYEFTIDAHVEGLINNQTYTDEVTFDFNGTGYLNDTYITPPFTVSEPGEYVLTISGENNYRDTYYFTIEESESSHTVVDFLQQYDIVLLGVTLVSGLLILKKK